MIKQSIEIEAIYVDDEEVKFRVSANSKSASSSIEIFGYIDTFMEFGSQLSKFPSSSKDEVKYELGHEVENWAYYLLLRVFCYKPTGATAIEVRMNNKKEVPELVKSTFYLLSIPASINRLGQSLENWNFEKNPVFKWESQIE